MTPQELKKSIIQLALKGQLTNHFSSSSVDDLLNLIKVKRDELVKKGLAKKAKISTPFEETPFDIPETWKWVRLSDVAFVNGGYAFKSSDYKEQGIRIIRISDFNEFGFVDSKIVRQEYKDEYEPYVLNINDILLCMTGGTVGKSYFVESMSEPMVTNQRVATIKIINPCQKYINYVILSPFVQKIIQDSKNSTNDNISMDTIYDFPIPLPPLDEQEQIVSVIEGLLPLIEKYGEAWEKLEAFNAKFPTDMKKSILQTAMKGKLVEQLDSEGSGQELLNCILDTQKSMYKKGQISKPKKYGEITEDEIPFEIPDNWVWARLSDVVYNHGQETPTDTFSYIDIGSIDNVNQRLNEVENLVEAKNAPSRARKIVEFGDIIYSTVRPYLHNMCIIDKKFSRKPIASTGFAVLCPFNGLSNKFLFYYLLSPQFDEYANRTDNSKGVAYPAINDDRLFRAVIPLPPLKEQERIVAKIEELLPLCRKLVK